MMMQTVFFAVVAVLMPWGTGVGARSVPIPQKPCAVGCTRQYDPQCATITAEFGNSCLKDAGECWMRIEGLTFLSVQDGHCPSSAGVKRRDTNPLTSLINHAFAKRQVPVEDCGFYACPYLLAPVCATYTATFSNPCVQETSICRLENRLYQDLNVTSDSCRQSPIEMMD